MNIPQQINFTGKLEEDGGATMFFIPEKQQQQQQQKKKKKEHHKIYIWNEANYSKFVTRKWNIIDDSSKTNYGVGSEIIYVTEFLKSNLCDFNDAYILVRGNITIMGHQTTQVSFKNCAPFIK